MDDKAENKRKRGWIIPLTIMIAVAVLLKIAGLLYSVADSLFNGVRIPPYSAMYPHAYPVKQVYVAGTDTVLDLTGGKLCFQFAEREHLNLSELCSREYCEGVISMEEALVEGEYPDISLHTDVDFTVPGEYTVTFQCSDFFDDSDDGKMLSCSFPIVVIDPKDAVN